MLMSSWALLAILIACSEISARGISTDRGVSPLTYIYTQSHALVLYLERALWPDPLVFDYGWNYVLKAADARNGVQAPPSSRSRCASGAVEISDSFPIAFVRIVLSRLRRILLWHILIVVGHSTVVIVVVGH